ncbi:hypothetical protein NL676_000131 [Syzygium grande]|nr:hypothetical protein NL676_000131 [Syzygium grande]
MHFDENMLNHLGISSDEGALAAAASNRPPPGRASGGGRNGRQGPDPARRDVAVVTQATARCGLAWVTMARSRLVGSSPCWARRGSLGPD